MDILAQMERLNYTIFTDSSKPFNLNIVGVRKRINTNLFDDVLTVFWWDNLGFNQRWYAITTDAGKTALNNPISESGTAILVPNQYRGVYQIDLHQGKYKALCQKKVVEVYRDNNKDSLHDLRHIEEGLFGINIHGASKSNTTSQVNNWSAGCQVFANWDDFQEFMNLCERASELWGNSFTYTLLNEIQ